MFDGCKTGRKVIAEAEEVPGSKNQAIDSLKEKSSTRFRTLKIRKAEIDIAINNERNSVKGNIAIYRDSLIAVSILPVLGYEAFRILCTRDSVILINRPEKTYSASSFENYKSKYSIPLSFNDILALFANELFYYKSDHPDRYFKRELSDINDKNLYLYYSFLNGKKVSSQSFSIDKKLNLLEETSIYDFDTKENMKINYSEFSEESGLQFPKKTFVIYSGEKNNFSIEFKYEQIVFNDSLNLKFAVPDNYKQVVL